MEVEARGERYRCGDAPRSHGFKEPLWRFQMWHLGKGPATALRMDMAADSLGEGHFCVKS